jgi:HK97 family phage prohead protease
MPIKTTDREYRDMVLSIVVDEEEREDRDERKIVSGYASTFDEPYTLFEDEDLIFNEVVDRSAFDNTDMSDVIMQYNHEGRVFARISNNTLTVTTDERGLLINANLGGTELGRQLYEEIEGGYTNKMSFGFTVDGEEERREEAQDGRLLITRIITSIRKLYDVSAVSIPANDATSISVRSLTDGVIEQIQAERLEAEKLELRRRKLLVRAKIGEL